MLRGDVSQCYFLPTHTHTHRPQVKSCQIIWSLQITLSGSSFLLWKHVLPLNCTGSWILPFSLQRAWPGSQLPTLLGDSGPLLPEPEHTHCLAKQREEAGWPLHWQPQSFWDTRVSPSYKLHPVCSQTGPTTRLYLLKGNLPQRVCVGAEGCGGGERCNRKVNFQRVKI